MKLSSPIFNFPVLKSSCIDWIQRHAVDIVVVSILSVCGGVACFWASQQIDSAIFFNGKQAGNVWFEADLPRVFANMTERGSDHYRTKVHPLFSLIAFPPVHALNKVVGFDAVTAVRLVMAAVAALWLGALYLLLRLVGCLRFDALLFSLLGVVSAASMFWFVVPETYPFGSLSILVALIFVALTQTRRFSAVWHIAVSALTLSFTTTNWMAGILATAVNHKWKRAGQIILYTFSLVTLLWGVQNFIFQSSEFFLSIREEQKYVVGADSGNIFQAFQSMIAHTMVMPTPGVFDNPNRPDWPMLLTQLSAPGSGSVWGSVATVVWLALLGLGAWGFFSMKQQPKLRAVLGLTLLGQLLLHLVYGNETFLYALHFLPLLILVAAMSTLTRARLVGLGLAGLLLVTAGLNNGLQFNQAKAFLWEHGTPRHQVQVQMEQRPGDPWPRGVGHVVLAAPGSLEADKAYHEPGGSFSPGVGTFGVSIWLVDGQGNVITTSDRIPLDQVQQQLAYPDGQAIPQILTTTDYYQSTWSSAGLGRWQLQLKPLSQGDANLKPLIAIRSVGPAGGEVQSLNWDGQQLLVNDRWSIKPQALNAAAQVTAAYVGEEGEPGWTKQQLAVSADASQWTGENGWGYALLAPPAGSDWQLTLEDAAPTPHVELSVSQADSVVDMNLPNPQFEESLNAQVAHLVMSLVGNQLRPGEPTNYPLPWQRDAAYELVALARAGQVDVAKELSVHLAENDFFGGFGAEADAPGLSIWALETVASQLNDPAYDRWLWPHIHRKAELILEMLAAKTDVHYPVTSPVVPKMLEKKTKQDVTLVAEPAKDGLIVGRMDGHRPLLFVNAVSYKGLIDAAALAQRLDQPDAAELWLAKAADLQQAWVAAFKPPESENARTYISSLWSTWIAASHQDAVRQGLEDRWAKRRDAQGGFVETPMWTYFDLAEAHQWLFLNEPDRAWTTLQWYWDNQVSPGLYTWWEGDGEENTSGRWEQVRGWVDPPHVTPHYWTAAEMLLLQLDMLAYVDRAASAPVLVVGGGIPASWIEQPMTVTGVLTNEHQVSWAWNGQQMSVQVQGDRTPVRLGSAFPENTPLKVEYVGKE